MTTKKLHALRKRYGRLTVLSETTRDGRRIAQVKCRCGRGKEVQVDALVAGRAKSCGRGACKAYARVGYDPDYHPQAPRTLSLATVKAAWARYNHELPAQRRTLAQLAVVHKVNASTLQSAFRSIRRAGGIAKYLAAVEK